MQPRSYDNLGYDQYEVQHTYIQHLGDTGPHWIPFPIYFCRHLRYTFICKTPSVKLFSNSYKSFVRKFRLFLKYDVFGKRLHCIAVRMVCTDVPIRYYNVYRININFTKNDPRTPFGHIRVPTSNISYKKRCTK